jgi:hypothetical protein
MAPLECLEAQGSTRSSIMPPFPPGPIQHAVVPPANDAPIMLLSASLQAANLPG